VSWLLELRYRPLEDLDLLRTLLLASCAEQSCRLDLLEQVFCLPGPSLARELRRLERWGLVERSPDGAWSATARGLRIIGVWLAMGKKSSCTFEVEGDAWPLGGGEFSVPFNIRNGDYVGTLVEEDLRLDEEAARKLVNNDQAKGVGRERETEKSRRRRLAAEGVLVYAWLRSQGGVIATAGAEEPAAFACRVREG
jgi:hypothetical protein